MSRFARGNAHQPGSVDVVAGGFFVQADLLWSGAARHHCVKMALTPTCVSPFPSATRCGLLQRLHLLAALGLVSPLAIGCGSGDDAEAQGNPHASLDLPVDQRGPYQAGYARYETTYTPDGETEPRTIVVHVWYPTEETSGEHPKYLDFFDGLYSFEGASLAPPLEKAGYPVHVYSHGDRGWGGTSDELMSYYASHGWVAVAPDHTGNTFNGNLDPRPTATYIARPQDISQSLDFVANLPASDPLAGKLQLDRVVMSGHSFGTYTTWAIAGADYDVDSIRAECPSAEGVCSEAELGAFATGFRDPRIVGGIPMAGGDSSSWFGDLDTAEIPIFLMSASGDPVGADTLYAEVKSLDLTWIEIAGGCHQLFALGGCPDVERQVGYAIVDTYALAFGRHLVLGDDSEATLNILDGTTNVSDLVTFQRKNAQ